MNENFVALKQKLDKSLEENNSKNAYLHKANT